MNIFQKCFRTPRSMIGDRPSPDSRSQLFPGIVSQSKHLHLWGVGNSFPQAGRRLLIGVAVWNGYDMALLDSIEECETTPLHIDVFDIDSCPTMEWIANIFPGIGPVSGSPAVGLWVNGELKQTAAGFAGRALAACACHLDANVLRDRIDNLNKRN